jgi:hypothetical protein
MAVIKRLSAKSSVKGIINYITNKEKTDEKIISGQECSPNLAYEQMSATKLQYNKTEGIQYHHVIQSFKPGEVSPEKAHALGVELAQNHFKGHECVISTHIDKEHIHNHIVANSINKETGKKYVSTKERLRELKKENDRLCEREKLSIPEKNKNRYLKMQEVEPAKRGESWKFKLMNQIDIAKQQSSTKDEFIKNMEQEGYQVNWTDSRKYITYTTPEGQKCRDSKLLKEYSKEVMENEYRGIESKEHAPGARTAGDRQQSDREGNVTTRDPAADIIFGDRGKNKTHSKRADQSVAARKKEPGRERDTEEGTRAEATNKQREPRKVDSAAQRDNKGIAAGNERAERNQQPEDGANPQEPSRRDSEQRNQEQGYIKTINRADSPSKEHTEPNLEGESKAVRGAALNDNGLDSGDIGNSPVGGTLNEIVKTLSKAIQKANQAEKASEVEKQQKAQQHRKHRHRDYDHER